MANENGVLAKLAGIRKRYKVDCQAEAARFQMNLQQHREKYLNEIIDLTMTDPNLAAVQKALDFFRPSNEEVTIVPPTGPATILGAPTEVPPAEAVKLAPPEKQPMKFQRRPVYGSCPNCNTPIWEAQSKFCSHCAYPLEEA